MRWAEPRWWGALARSNARTRLWSPVAHRCCGPGTLRTVTPSARSPSSSTRWCDCRSVSHAFRRRQRCSPETAGAPLGRSDNPALVAGDLTHARSAFASGSRRVALGPRWSWAGGMVDGRRQLHVMCERDVGLFSLVQQSWRMCRGPWRRGERRSPTSVPGPVTGHPMGTGAGHGEGVLLPSRRARHRLRQRALFSEPRARNSQRNSAAISHRHGPHAKRIDQLAAAASAELAATPTWPPRAKAIHESDRCNLRI